jgi:maintenance of morphology protein 1
VLPVALAVSVVRFSGTLSISFIPSNAAQSTPAAMTFNFLDDYRLDLSVRSLLGSRSKLQDVPKIAQLIEARLHRWFDERCVEPRFQEIALPSLWPRKKNTRGPDDSLGDTVNVSIGKARGQDVGSESTQSSAEHEMDREGRDLPPGSLRLRRRAREDGEFSMPGALPGFDINARTSSSSAATT